VQRIRIERAKRLLEASDPAYFRRLFKRLTAFTPGAYRQRFRVPAMPDGA
jgi:YesN/AraC family two-component response regulator